MANLILVINPGSTSTKVALFDGEVERCSESLSHSADDLKGFDSINDQYEFRKDAVMAFLEKNGVKPEELDGIACRGAALAELEPGAYVVDEHFVELARVAINPHPANLALMIGYELKKQFGTPCYAYDLVCGTGKPEEVFTLSGLKEITRPFLTHVLNARAVSFEQAKRDNTSIYDNTYIVCHLGGGVSTNLIVNGIIKDICGDDENGFSPERAGSLPCRKLVRLCFSGKYTEKEVQKLMKGKGGLMSYLGTSDIRDVEKMINDGDEYAKMVLDAMVLQLAKDIGSMAAVVNGKVDKIILTGGIAFSKMFTDLVTEKVSFLAPVSVIPGAFEMEALAKGIDRVLKNEEAAQTYTGEAMHD